MPGARPRWQDEAGGETVKSWAWVQWFLGMGSRACKEQVLRSLGTGPSHLHHWPGSIPTDIIYRHGCLV